MRKIEVMVYKDGGLWWCRVYPTGEPAARDLSRESFAEWREAMANACWWVRMTA